MDSFNRFSPSHKAPPRKGRRANNQAIDDFNTSNADDDFTSDDLEVSAPGSSSRVGILSSPTKMPVEVPPRSRKTGGWAEENSSSKSGKEKFPLAPDTPQKIGSDDDIPLIPDLDELQDEEMLTQVARAPLVVGSKLASFVELDSDLMKHSALSTLDDINLGAISCRLYPEADVKEADNLWTWDLLFTEVASDLRTEWENTNGADISIT